MGGCLRKSEPETDPAPAKKKDNPTQKIHTTFTFADSGYSGFVSPPTFADPALFSYASMGLNSLELKDDSLNKHLYH